VNLPPIGDPKLSRRAKRLASVIQQVLARQISELSDPALEGVFITAVEVGVDLDLATVYFYCSGEDQEFHEAAAALERAVPRFRRTLSASLHTKKVPRLRFKKDPGIESGLTVEKRLSEIFSEKENGGLNR
jgi:ribosome-binding factor A